MSETPASRSPNHPLSTSGNRWSEAQIGPRPPRSRPRPNVKFSVTDPDSAGQTDPSELYRTSTPEPVAKKQNPKDWTWQRTTAAQKAFVNANKHADKVEKHNSASNSRRASFQDLGRLGGIEKEPYLSPPPKVLLDQSIELDDISLEPSSQSSGTGRVFDLPNDSTDSESEDAVDSKRKAAESVHPGTLVQARSLVESFRNVGRLVSPDAAATELDGIRSGNATPRDHEHLLEFDYIPRPDQYKPSVLSMLLAASRTDSASAQRKHQEDYLASKLAEFKNPETDPRSQYPDFFSLPKYRSKSTGNLSGSVSPFSGRASGTSTPKPRRPKWYDDTRRSNPSLSGMLSPHVNLWNDDNSGTVSPQKPILSRSSSVGRLDSAIHMLKHPLTHIKNLNSGSTIQLEQQTLSIAERLSAQDYLLLMCRALMQLGAPTHRLEEYMTMASRKLCIAGSFQYLPNCMIVSFDDPVTHTSELKLIKEPPAVDLGKLKDVQEVYKDVIHDKYSTQEAIDDIQYILQKPKKFKTTTLILMYGVAAVSVGPFAFSAQPKDFPIAFFLGALLGGLQLLLAPRSSQFSHVFEVAGTFITSLAARGFGSILDSHGVPVFCFSALAQSSIALILPGWIILSAALELQSRNMIAGSIRMVYAIIYTLFLGFGILIGTTIMGLLYSQATDDITCHLPAYWSSTPSWHLVYTKFIWVPLFTVCLAMINQAKWRQMPAMILIASLGYQVNHWSAQKFAANLQVANALGAFAVGTAANLYSRFAHGVAAAVMLPAIFVMVPSGLAASGSLVAGLTSANQIIHNTTGISVVNNGTQGFYDAQTASSGTVYGGTIFNVGYGMVQVAIGISVGLFLSALVIYPFGKRRSGLFSF